MRYFISGVNKSGSSAVVAWINDRLNVSNVRNELNETRLITFPLGVGALYYKYEKKDEDILYYLNAFPSHMFGHVKSDFFSFLYDKESEKISGRRLASQANRVKNIDVGIFSKKIFEAIYHIHNNAENDTVAKKLNNIISATYGKDDVLFNNDPNCEDIEILRFLPHDSKAKIVCVVRDFRGMFADHVLKGFRENNNHSAEKFCKKIKSKIRKMIKGLDAIADNHDCAVVVYDNFVKKSECKSRLLSFLTGGCENKSYENLLFSNNYDPELAKQGCERYFNVIDESVSLLLENEWEDCMKMMRRSLSRKVVVI